MIERELKMNIYDELFMMRDEEYKNFHAKLIPNVDRDCIIGVRTPDLRKFAKEVFKNGNYTDFLNSLPHKYYEENNLHAFLIEQIKDYDLAAAETERFLPYIDNWATCDMFLPKVFKKNTEKLLAKIKEWIKSDKTYTVRYAIGLLMRLYLGDNFKEEYMIMVSEIKSEQYYINMMAAWYFATALANRYDTAVKYIEERKLDKWVHNKAIQKASESSRIDTETKKYLKTLKL